MRYQTRFKENLKFSWIKTPPFVFFVKRFRCCQTWTLRESCILDFGSLVTEIINMCHKEVYVCAKCSGVVDEEITVCDEEECVTSVNERRAPMLCCYCLMAVEHEE